MDSRIIIPTEHGERLSYELHLHQGGGRDELKIVFSTSEESFERWLFYLLRDVGAQIVTDDPARLRNILSLTQSESGVVSQAELDGTGATQHFVKV